MFYLYGGVFHLIDFVIDQFSYHVAVQQIEQGYGDQCTGKRNQVALNEAFAHVGAKVEQWTFVGNEHGSSQCGINNDRKQKPPETFPHQHAA